MEERFPAEESAEKTEERKREAGKKQLPAGVRKAIPYLGVLLLLIVVIVVVACVPGGTKSLAADTLNGQKEDADERLAMAETYGVVYLDGVAVASLRTYEEALSVPDRVVAHYQTEGSEITSCTVDEKMDVREIVGVPWNPVSVEGAVSLIVNGTEEVKTYTVQKGDSMYGIAAKVGMTFPQLLAANPTSTPNKLSIGQILNIVEVKPMVHVAITERVTVTETVGFSTKYESNADLYIGTYKVKSAGVKGKNEVVYDVTSVNGKQTSKEKVETRVVSAPVTQITYKGTKPIPNVIGTGVFRYPLDGSMSINSSYGIYRGSVLGTHGGVDFSARTGDPIYAADDGAVTFAGSSGTYGNLVKLSHGNGYETYYAHCSELLVSVGDTVKKGDVIAKAGRTGRATGPHLHFEVRVNGVKKNPVDYLP